jgi:uncharacterized protein (DUF983 family)
MASFIGICLTTVRSRADGVHLQLYAHDHVFCISVILLHLLLMKRLKQTVRPLQHVQTARTGRSYGDDEKQIQ